MSKTATANTNKTEKSSEVDSTDSQYIEKNSGISLGIFFKKNAELKIFSNENSKNPTSESSYKSPILEESEQIPQLKKVEKKFLSSKVEIYREKFVESRVFEKQDFENSSKNSMKNFVGNFSSNEDQIQNMLKCAENRLRFESYAEDQIFGESYYDSIDPCEAETEKKVKTEVKKRRKTLKKIFRKLRILKKI